MPEESVKKSFRPAPQVGGTFSRATEPDKSSEELEARVQRLERQLVALRAEVDYLRAKRND